MNRGEVWWVEHPDTGRRPALVLTRQDALPLLRKVIVVPATRTRRGIPTEVALDEDDGMPTACALSLDNIRTVPQSLLTQRITRLGFERMFDVCRALAHATGC
ncbi:MAG: type II toxin-antitoxin system PemK/MazF family toxin [Egibacteraceae bacterium]